MDVGSPRSALIVGAGLMGQWHAHALGRVGVPIVGVVDNDPKRAEALSNSVGAARPFSSIDQALAASEATVAHVCTPLSTHFELGTRLLEAGLHVLMEKPLTQEASQTTELVRLADTRRLRLCPVHQFLFQSGFRELESALAESGSVLHVDYVARSAGAEGSSAERAEEIMGEILPHPLSMLRRICGDSLVHAQWRTFPGTPGELRAGCTSDGATLGIVISLGGRPTCNDLTIICEKATFHVDLFHGFCVMEPSAAGRVGKVLRPFGLAARSMLGATLNLATRTARWEPAYPGLRRLIDEFYGATGGNGVAPIAPQETIDIAAMRDRILSLRVTGGETATGGVPSDP